MDAKALLDHQFVVAAYSVTWIIQLGYLAWLGLNGGAKSVKPPPMPVNPADLAINRVVRSNPHLL